MNHKNQFVNCKQISELFSMSLRQVQRNARKLYSTEEGVVKKNGYKIHKDLICLFSPVYRKVVKKPEVSKISFDDWDLFCDFVPDNYTKPDVLQAVMNELFNYLKAKLKQPIKIFYILEMQPEALIHVHYFVKSKIGKIRLKKIIEERIEILNLCNQYHRVFMNDIKQFATSYLYKGRGVNYKNAKFIYSELLSSGYRQNN